MKDSTQIVGKQSKNTVRLGGLRKISLNDYPSQICSTIFLAGCNFKCPYCHNKQLINYESGHLVTFDTIEEQISDRTDFITSIIISGGEPCAQPNIIDFVKHLKTTFADKKLGIHTNGSFPEILSKLLPYLDFVGMDVKTSLEDYHLVNCSNSLKIHNSILMLSKEVTKKIEFRITCAKTIINENKIIQLAKLLKSSNVPIVLQKCDSDVYNVKDSEIREYKSILESFGCSVFLRL